MLLHAVTMTAVEVEFKVISPHDGMMAKCLCLVLISVCTCSSGILKQRCGAADESGESLIELGKCSGK